MDPLSLYYVALLHQWKGDSVLVSGERQDIFIGAGFLGQELVTGECDDCESATLVLLVEELELLVLGRESTVGCCIYDKQYISFVFRKGARVSRDAGWDGSSNPTRSPRNRISFSSSALPNDCDRFFVSFQSTNTLNSFDKN